MAKQGRKMRTRNTVSDSETSAIRNRSQHSANEDDKPDVAIVPPQKSTPHRVQPSGSHPAGIPSIDTTHSPYFLHSADQPGLVIANQKLDGLNYNNWHIAMRMSLDAKNKIGFVDGSLPRPAQDDPMFKIWSRCNSMVKSWLLNTVTQKIYDRILYYDDAVEMWNDLYSRFRVSNLPRKYQLEQSIAMLKQGSLDLSAYYTKKKTLWEQLSNTRITTARRCQCDHVKELMEEAETSRIIQFLMGLNENFANIRGQILNMKPRPSLTEIYNMLDQDESQRIVGSAQRTTNHHVAFQVQDTLTSEPNQVLLSQGSYHKVKCSYCSRLGHTIDKCYKKHGYPPGMFKGKKPNAVASTNMALTPSVNRIMVNMKKSLAINSLKINFCL
ncbi:uncharacterized protein LOC106362631 [Brassica napus]|uniref:uncharacterized protein LOC106303225 n=1 Tax=Brassica oleracea var. oleracea TaxID=109376 RepID=UPI0006A6E7FC|nr:PREDICTED: uncharacterized protein LOC106303225 [Brassica oleracea var. oleracea]XP_013657954.1 uncharacterized protein LOC106362631 [Brassica napus]